MDESINFFVGLDAHKDSISVAVCEAGREPSRFVGTLGPDVQGVLKTLRKYGPARHVSVVYEAGPTGYGLYRELNRRGYRCEIIAPSLIPRRAGTDMQAAIGRQLLLLSGQGLGSGLSRQIESAFLKFLQMPRFGAVPQS